MAYTPTCLVCQKEMELGFMTDMGHYDTIRLPRWCAGTPEASFWSGEAKSSQARTGAKVTAYRCPTCKALRLYAFDEPAQG